MGYRFRLHRKDLPGTPDIVLPSRRAIVFVHGCFWHGHGCKIGQSPKSRPEYWQPKLARNRDRDREKAAALEDAGWRVLTVWQCELRDISALERKLEIFFKNASDSDRLGGSDMLGETANESRTR
jgi:DNA mismatch endonuclease (patch repair protein)